MPPSFEEELWRRDGPFKREKTGILLADGNQVWERRRRRNVSLVERPTLTLLPHPHRPSRPFFHGQKYLKSLGIMDIVVLPDDRTPQPLDIGESRPGNRDERDPLCAKKKPDALDLFLR